MTNIFELVGKIIPTKDKNGNYFTTNTYASGWMNTTVNFAMACGNERVYCRVQGGKWKDDKRNVVKTMTPSYVDDAGNRIASTKIDIPWSDRFDEETCKKVAGYRKFIFDESNERERSLIRFARKAVESEEWENTALKRYPFKTMEEANECLKAEINKKHSYIAEYDFAEFMTKFITSNYNRDTLYKVTGTYDISYNEGRFYTTYHVTRIVKAEDNEEPRAQLPNLKVFISKDFIDDESAEDTGKAFIRGWLEYYDSGVRENGYSPISIALYGDEKKYNFFKRKTADLDDDAIAIYGMKIDIINSTSFREITEDDLSDEEKEDIEFGIRTFESIKASRSGRVAGDRLSELRFVTLVDGKLTETDKTISMMNPAKKVDVVADLTDDDEDLFDDIL